MLCDTHVHIVGDPDTYPMLPGRTYTAGLASVADLEHAAVPAGVSRFVIVQPSFYGTDNTLLLESLDTLDARGRGVAVVDPVSVSHAELEDYAARGVRGLRINLYSSMSAQESGDLHRAFAAMADLAQKMAWHVQVIAPLAMLARTADLLGAAQVPVVIDHYGLYAGHAPDSAAGRQLLDLLRRTHVWVKLSAPYRSSDDPFATRPDPAWLAAILAAAGERCVWGSDWPHTPPHAMQTGNAVPLPYRALDYRTVVGDFRAALPSAAVADAIMGDNPARLYDF